ncbi:DUF371 domain-containing protein [Candidatus Woesearchaeota archaeon]|nr:DUF371 domain-containing protein [Candidatus Woesearchaeota archaeon]
MALSYTFPASGHRNITARHSTTLEFTKDTELTEKGDCIIAVGAQFSFDELKRFLSCKKVVVTVTAAGITDRIIACPNPGFNSDHEIVIRKASFTSPRTFATSADKAAVSLSRLLIGQITKGRPIEISIRHIE